MFWNNKDDDDGFKLPDGMSEDDVDFVVRGPEDLDKLPPEVVLALMKQVMGDFGKLLHMSRALCSEMVVPLVQMYATAIKLDDNGGKGKVVQELKRSIDMIGSYMVENNMVTSEEFETTIQVGIDMALGKIEGGSKAGVAEYHRRMGKQPNGKVESHAPQEEIERAKKVGDLFNAALNPNSNRAKRADDAF